ncbi:MAG: hypothetical protein WC622_07120 [Pedobacter sp.]|jgi:hypothetical protein|uniref:hypothetical protein n=1 Tax=Pedobacter sp. TaxID=1411316 RepID=UPI00356281F9
MTKLFIVAILSIYTILNLNGSTNLKDNYQTTYQVAQDTAKYLEDNFINKKVKFQHRKLKYLLAKLKLNVKSYVLVRNLKIVGEKKGILIYFEERPLIKSKWEKKIKVNSIYIEFEKPISICEDATNLHIESNGKWLPAEVAFYGKRLVKDIVSGN